MAAPQGLSPSQTRRLLPMGVTADDLAGAADTAAALARPGAPVAVSLTTKPRTRGGRAAFAVTTESRARGPEEVHDLVRRSAEALRAAGAQLLYAKVDSNLRGSIGAAMSAIEEVAGGPVLLAPAFPARGRTTVDGVVLVAGQPVAETEMAHDPEAPVVSSRLVELLCSPKRDMAVSLCPLSVVRAGPKAVSAAMPRAGVLALDAETDADLDVIAEAAVAAFPPLGLAGSAGLAAALGRRLLGPPSARQWPAGRAGPVLAVLASSSETLGTQVAAAAASSHLTPIALPCEYLTWEDAPLPELRGAMEAGVWALRAGKDALVYACGRLPRAERPVELVVEHLAHLAFVAVKEAKPRALLVGGGATAQAVLGALGTEVVEVDEEPLPGIAAGVAVGGDLDGRPVALKPGAAGDEDAITRLLHYLGRRARAAEVGR